MTAIQQERRNEVTSNGKEPKRIDMPMLGIEIRRRQVEMPHMPMPHINKQEIGHYVDAARTILPPPERVAYYGALGAMAVFGAIEWPVAAAIGMGMAIAQRGRQESSKPDTSAQAQRRSPAKPGTPAQAQQEEPKKRRTAAAQRAATEAASKRKSAPKSK